MIDPVAVGAVLGLAALAPYFATETFLGLFLCLAGLIGGRRALGRWTKVREALDADRRWADRRRRFDLSAEGGFVPTAAATALPAAFRAWETLGERLPHLNATGELYAHVEALPTLDASALLALPDPQAALCRAYVLLGLVLQSYANRHGAKWGLVAGGAAESVSSTAPDETHRSLRRNIPRPLAEPWRFVCGQLDLPTGAICACGTDLWNVAPRRRRSSDGEIVGGYQPDVEGSLSVSMTGTRTEACFHLVATAMQRRAGRDLRAVFSAPDALAARDDAAVGVILIRAEALARDLKSIFATIWTTVDADIFFHVHRPLLAGSWDAPLDLAGTQGRAQGPSAGQSALFILLDLLLGVRRGAETSSSEEKKTNFEDEATASSHAAFQTAMLAYMPLRHRDAVATFAQEMAAAGSFAAYVGGRPKGPRRDGLRRALGRALDAYADLRRYHLAVAMKYLRRTGKGTGGSDFVPMLNDGIRRTTARATEVKLAAYDDSSTVAR